MKKTLKKLLCLVMALSMAAFVFAGCGTSESADKDATTAADDGKTYKIGICQLVQHEALDAATEGFKKALTEKLGDKVEFDEQNASNDSATCATICSGFVANSYDLIMANATPALQSAAQATTTIPIVATSITDYGTALDIKDWTGKTGINVTGTADLAPLDKQADMVKELFPDAKTVGILYCSAEANSKYQATTITENFKELGIEVKEYTFSDSNDVASVATKAAEECDVLYSPTDNTVASNAEGINNIIEPAKVPLVAGEAGICKGCGVATLSISYDDIGYKAGLMAYEILVNGKDPAEMDIEFADTFTKQFMKDRAEALGVTIPDDYAEIEAE